MFADETLDAIEFKSTWKKERSLEENGTQTGPLETFDVASQAIRRKHKDVQTDEYIDEEIDIRDNDSPELLDFLSRSYKLMKRMLEKNARSRAFDEFQRASAQENRQVICTHALTNADNNNVLQITSLSWNNTGSVIAASFGRHDHEDWCYHSSTLCTWNLDRRGLDVNKPDTVIDLSCCLTCTAFHPKKTAWIVGGTFNGELILWDIGQEDEQQIATSGIGDDSHREPVSKVQWVLDPDSKSKRYNVVSVSGDGTILIWQVSERKQKLKLHDGYVLLTESLPRHIRVKAKGNQQMGVTCLSFNKMDESTFIIGSESGGIFKCDRNTRGTPAKKEVKCSIDLRSPVTLAYQPHTGPVYSVECSPFHRNLFVSCGTDTSARLYSLLVTQPISTIEPGLGYIYCTKWSPIRPLVFASTTESGHLLIYDMKHSRSVPVCKLEASPKKQPVYALEFNPSNFNLLATGDAHGYIHIWKLSDELTTQNTNELAQLEEISNVISTEEITN